MIHLILKWLLDIGSDFHRRCYGNFFTCDDQKGSRRDNKNYEVRTMTIAWDSPFK